MPAGFYEILGRRVRIMREKAGWTQVQLAERIGVTSPYLSMYETARAALSLEVLRRVATVFRVSLPELLSIDADIPVAKPFVPPPRKVRRRPPLKELDALEKNWLALPPKMRRLASALIEEMVTSHRKKRTKKHG